jgi:hypothetical protein
VRDGHHALLSVVGDELGLGHLPSLREIYRDAQQPRTADDDHPIRVWTRATACEPKMMGTVIARMTNTAKTLTQIVEPSATAPPA